MIEESKKEADMVSDTACPSQNVKIGDRVECLGYIGTVKYIGPVESYPSTWLGIDWDDQYRGKHNGTLNGVKYFETRYPKSGSFVRPQKVTFGHSVILSIINRYGREENEVGIQEFQQQLVHFQQSINAPFLEMVGFEKVSDKQSNFDSLKVVNLRLQNINTSSEPGQLRQLCPNIQELDLSKNLMSSWLTVFEICSELDHLWWLNLSENILSIPENLSDYMFPSIETLICTSMNITWADITNVSDVFPHVNELRVPFNNMQSLDTTPNVLINLRILDIENNPIGSWSEICKLNVLENLEELFIGNIGLRKIEFDSDQPKVDLFKKLKKLSISYNLLDNWESINELNRLKKLEDLRCIKNPILEMQKENTRFQIVVARIGNLKILNGTEIKSDSRRGAEYDYMKMYGLEYLSVRNTPQESEFFKLHNRYSELINLYGSPEESELIIKPKSIVNTLVNLNLVYEDRVIEKKLPQTIVIQKLVLLVQKMFNLTFRPRLIYVSETNSKFTVNLEEYRELGFYSMQDGDKILVVPE